jgi:predicted protein tyrosine phosphatase
VLNVLFLCSQNKLRSPTAEAIFSEYKDLEVTSAGLDDSAAVPVDSEALDAADIIFVMERSHRVKLSKKYQRHLRDKRVICLDIPDEYDFMDPALVAILEKKVLPLLRKR